MPEKDGLVCCDVCGCLLSNDEALEITPFDKNLVCRKHRKFAQYMNLYIAIKEYEATSKEDRSDNSDMWPTE